MLTDQYQLQALFGVVCMLALSITALIPLLRKKGYNIDYKWHPIIARVSIALTAVYVYLSLKY